MHEWWTRYNNAASVKRARKNRDFNNTTLYNVSLIIASTITAITGILIERNDHPQCVFPSFNIFNKVKEKHFNRANDFETNDPNKNRNEEILITGQRFGD